MLEFVKDEVKDFLKSEAALFHYTKLSTTIEKILNERTLLMNNANNLNDYREIKYSRTFWIPSEDKQIDSLRLNKIQKEFYNLLPNYRIICFCSNDQKIDDSMGSTYHEIFDSFGVSNPYKMIYGYQKDRMWNIYSENYRGCCLVFNKNELKKFITKKYLINKDDYVSYTMHTDSFFHEIDCRNANTLEETNNLIMKKLFVKHYDYKDENEYRFIINKRTSQKIKIDITKSLYAILTGPNFNEIYLSIIIDLLKKINIKKISSKVALIKYEIGGDGADKLYHLKY